MKTPPILRTLTRSFETLEVQPVQTATVVGSSDGSASYGSDSKDSMGLAGLTTNESAEWQPPLRFFTIDQMRREDAAVKSAFWLLTQPIRSALWSHVPVSRDPADRLIADACDWQFGLGGNDIGKLDLSWREQLSQSLLYLAYGSMFEEIMLGDVDIFYDADGDPHIMRPFSRLAPRFPQTIKVPDGFVTDPRTGLIASLEQWLPDARPIPGNKLVWYVLDREGVDWYGTALAVDTPLPTPDGWRMIGDLEVGDRVFDEQGMIRHVTATRRWKDRPCYRVSVAGDEIVADENHLWESFTYLARNSRRDHQPTVLRTKELAAQVKYAGIANHALRFTQPLQHVEQNLLIDPYVLGYWLGDGSQHAATITTMDSWVIEEFDRRGYPCSWRSQRGKASAYGVAGDLQRKLRMESLLLNKHVPAQYLRGSVRQRLDLLRGLMDSDGNTALSRNASRGEFTNTNPLLTLAVAELVRSLGGRVVTRVKDRSRDRETADAYAAAHPKPAQGQREIGNRPILGRKDAHVASFDLPLVPFGIPRKADAYAASLHRTRPRRYHYIRAVERVENRDTVCIEVDSPSHLYLAGRSMVPTHNSLLRPMYGAWKLKRAVMISAGIGWDRFAFGTPVVRYPQGAGGQKRKAEEMARNWRTHERGWFVLEGTQQQGWDIEIVGGQGNFSDPTPLIHTYDEQIASAALQHFIVLGRTGTGARAVGDALAEPYYMFLQSIADDIAEAKQRHLLRKFVDLNFGAEFDVPKLNVSKLQSRNVAVLAASIAALADAGFSFTDPETQNDVRDILDLRQLPIETQQAIGSLPDGVGVEPPVTPAPPAMPGQRQPAAGTVALREREGRGLGY